MNDIFFERIRGSIFAICQNFGDILESKLVDSWNEETEEFDWLLSHSANLQNTFDADFSRLVTAVQKFRQSFELQAFEECLECLSGVHLAARNVQSFFDCIEHDADRCLTHFSWPRLPIDYYFIPPLRFIFDSKTIEPWPINFTNFLDALRTIAEKAGVEKKLSVLYLDDTDPHQNYFLARINYLKKISLDFDKYLFAKDQQGLKIAVYELRQTSKYLSAFFSGIQRDIQFVQKNVKSLI